MWRGDGAQACSQALCSWGSCSLEPQNVPLQSRQGKKQPKGCRVLWETGAPNPQLPIFSLQQIQDELNPKDHEQEQPSSSPSHWL